MLVQVARYAFLYFPVSTRLSTKKALTKHDPIRIYLSIIVYSSEGIVLPDFWGYSQGCGEQQNQQRVQMKTNLNLTCIS